MSAEHSLARLCAAFDVSWSGYHAWKARSPSARAQADAALMSDIAAIHDEHRGRYGAPRIHRELADQGKRHGRKRVARLMKLGGFQGRCPRRFVPHTTDSDHQEPIAPNRLAEAPAPTGPNQAWVSDLTYVRTGEGGLYVAVILDLWSRRVVGWSCGDTLAAGLVVAALSMALQHRRPSHGLVPHSDRGGQPV